MAKDINVNKISKMAKSISVDRIIELSKTIQPRDMTPQTIDQRPLTLPNMPQGINKLYAGQQIVSSPQTANPTLPMRLGYLGESVGKQFVGDIRTYGRTAEQAAIDRETDKANAELDKLKKDFEAMKWSNNALGKNKGFDSPEYKQARERLIALDAQIKSMETKSYIAPDDKSMQLSKEAREAEGKYMQGLTGVGKGIAELGSAAAHMAPAIGVGLLPLPGAQAVGLGLMGAQAAGSKAYELNQQGVPATEAAKRGFISGGIEALTELTPLDTLATLIKKGGKSFVKSALKQAGIEAAEENLSLFMNYAADKAAGDTNAKVTPQDWLKTTWQSFALGGLMGGAGHVIGNISNRQGALPDLTKTQDIVDNKPQTAVLPQNSVSTPQTIPQAANNTPAQIVAPTALKQAELPQASKAPVQEQKQAEAYPAEKQIDNRTFQSVGSQKVKAFQFDHPNLHQYFADAARGMLGDLRETTRAERFASTDTDGYYDNFGGVKRNTTDEIAALKDNANLTYDQIEKALNDIIENHGQENYAAAKKVEILLNEMLTFGGTDISGEAYAPNQEYINAKKAIAGELETDYSMSEEDWNSARESELPQGVGAASGGFNPYSKLQNTYGTYEAGEQTRAREVDVPKQTQKNNRVSQLIRTVMEATATPEEMISKVENAVVKEKFSSIPITDKAAGSRAESVISGKGWDNALRDWTADVRSGKAGKDIAAMGFTLYNNAANSGHSADAMDILVDLTTTIRSGAQSTQAVRMLKKMSPSYQLYALNRSVQNFQDELIKKYGDKAPNLKIDETLAKEYLDAKDDDARNAAMEKIYKHIGSQIPSTFYDKWNHWRYMAMLFNAKTHIRNIVGNAAFMPVRMLKNITASGIESAVSKVSKIDRTKAILTTKDAGLISAAWQDYSNIADQITQVGKYDDAANKIEEARTIFKTKTLEKTRLRNAAWLETEDVWFSRPAYAESLASYLKANNISAEQFKGLSEFELDKARAYAVKEAQKATYRDRNEFSDWISKLGKNYSGTNKLAKSANVLVEGVLPFKRTPANILVRGFEYSPVGLAKGLTYDLVQVAKGNKTAAHAIDQIASGLTGTAIMGLGAYLASQALISGGSDEDEKNSAYQKMQGAQDYALQIGNNTYSFDWLAPVSMPLFIGVALYNAMQNKSEKGVSLPAVLNAIGRISDPALETSMLQSVNDMVSNVSYSESPLFYLFSQAALNYLGQAVPTLFGQAARTIDETRRTTYASKESQLTKTGESFLNKIENKIPGLSLTNQPYIDLWGREQKDENTLRRTIENFFSPAYIEPKNVTSADQEINRLYASTGESSVIPRTAQSYQVYSDKTYYLTPEELTAKQKLLGQTSLKIVSNLISNAQYKNLADADKAKVIDQAYGYAAEKAKIAFLKGRNVSYSPDKAFQKAQDAEKTGVPIDLYFVYRNVISDFTATNDKGETENGLKKQRVTDYINSLSLSDKLKTYLLELEYPPSEKKTTGLPKFNSGSLPKFTQGKLPQYKK